MIITNAVDLQCDSSSVKFQVSTIVVKEIRGATAKIKTTKGRATSLVPS